MTSFSNANPRLTTFIGCFIGYILIGDLSSYEQNSLGNFFELVGQVLLANAAQQALVVNNASPTPNINSREIKSIYNPLFYDEDKLRDILSCFNDNYTKDTLDFILKSIEIMREEIIKIKKES